MALRRPRRQLSFFWPRSALPSPVQIGLGSLKAAYTHVGSASHPCYSITFLQRHPGPPATTTCRAPYANVQPFPGTHRYAAEDLPGCGLPLHQADACESRSNQPLPPRSGRHGMTASTPLAASSMRSISTVTAALGMLMLLGACPSRTHLLSERGPWVSSTLTAADCRGCRYPCYTR